ncbi:MAG: hypothetical protein JSW62_04595 [Thermoplasmatales archaeon]|nr:MAG: hypothetical protein JSW62_04595 [Thermoplasmatales archaeon]
MLIDSMVIKLFRTGAGISPEYKLTVYGDGRVIYEGIENVQEKGIIESSIDDNAVLSILNEFKESGFFSLSDIFSIKDSIDRPFTSISISIPKGDGQTIRKSVKYFHGDRQVPNELKNLVDKIDEIVGTVKWISGSTLGLETKKESISTPNPYSKKKTTLEPRKKKPIVLIYRIIFIVILLIIVAYGLYSGIISFPKEKDEVNSLSGDNDEVKPPNFIILEPASYVDNVTGDYIPTESFSIGDIVSIYLKYSDISTTKNDTCNLYFEIIVESNEILYHKPVGETRTEIGKSIQVWFFETNDLWPSGQYNVTVSLTDYLTDLKTTGNTTFSLI